MTELVEKSQGCLSLLGPSAIHAVRTILSAEPSVDKVDAVFFDKKHKYNSLTKRNFIAK